MRRTALKTLIAVLSSALALLLASGATATAAPSSGYDDWNCRPSAAHPEPVVLIHGTFATGPMNWMSHGPALAKAGYCAFELTYGVAAVPGLGGQAPIAESAKEVAAFVDKVLKSTGSAKVDLVGHSQGALLSLYLPKVLGYADRVGKVVALAPPTHGTNTPLLALAPLVGCTASCPEMAPGSPIIKALTTGPVAQPGVDYTIFATRTDAIVTPVTTAFVDEPGVHNRYVQDTCPLDPVGHIGIALDSTISSLLVTTLDPAAGPVNCGVGLPL